MNNLILELANKANKDIGYTFKMEDAKQIHELMEKFAELIVLECCDTLYDNELGGYQVNYVLKEHFGVNK